LTEELSVEDVWDRMENDLTACVSQGSTDPGDQYYKWINGEMQKSLIKKID